MKSFFTTLAFFALSYSSTILVAAELEDGTASIANKQRGLRGWVDTAFRRVLVGGTGECLSHEVWKQTKQLGTGSMWETILATQELIGVALQSNNGQLSQLSLEWIPYLHPILDPAGGQSLVSTIVGMGNLFCDPEDNTAFALYTESCAAWSAHIQPLIKMLEGEKAANDNNAEIPKKLNGEKNALRRFIVAEANYHCERQTLFEEHLPSLAESQKGAVWKKRDALLALQALLPENDAAMATALSCFDAFF